MLLKYVSIDLFITRISILIFFSLLLISCSTTQLNRDKADAKVTRITESGNSSEDAKQRAFKRAIEYRVGVLIVGERIVENQEINQKLLTYSSGFIRDYQLVESQIKGGKYVETYDIWVEDSKIAEGLLSIKNINFSFEGKKLLEVIKNKDLQNNNAAELVGHLLEGWPSKAINITYNSRSVEYDINRNVLLNLNGISINWSKDFEKSLQEAFDRVSIKPSRNNQFYIIEWNQDNTEIEYSWNSRFENFSKTYHDDGPSLFSPLTNKRYYISDTLILNNITDNFSKLIYIKIDLKNRESTLDHYCLYIEGMRLENYYPPPRIVIPNINKYIKNIKLNLNRSDLEKITNVEISVVSSNCK
jgi:hypothetical protein